MKREVKQKQSLNIEDGKHEGTIIAVQERNEPFNYIDLVIKTADSNGNEGQLKVGFPDCLTVDSKLGQLLQRFNVALTAGNTINVEEQLLNRKVTFSTIAVERKGKTFIDIQPQTVKPKEQ